MAEKINEKYQFENRPVFVLSHLVLEQDQFLRQCFQHQTEEIFYRLNLFFQDARTRTGQSVLTRPWIPALFNLISSNELPSSESIFVIHKSEMLDVGIEFMDVILKIC